MRRPPVSPWICTRVRWYELHPQAPPFATFKSISPCEGLAREGVWTGTCPLWKELSSESYLSSAPSGLFRRTFRLPFLATTLLHDTTPYAALGSLLGRDCVILFTDATTQMKSAHFIVDLFYLSNLYLGIVLVCTLWEDSLVLTLRSVEEECPQHALFPPNSLAAQSYSASPVYWAHILATSRRICTQKMLRNLLVLRNQDQEPIFTIIDVMDERPNCASTPPLRNIIIEAIERPFNLH